MPLTTAEGDDQKPTLNKRKDNTKMDYENFKEQFVADVKDRLAEQGADVKVSINEVNKLNESYEAITVTPEGSNIGVNMSLEKFYDAVQDGTPYDSVVDKAVDVIKDGIGEGYFYPEAYHIEL